MCDYTKDFRKELSAFVDATGHHANSGGYIFEYNGGYTSEQQHPVNIWGYNGESFVVNSFQLRNSEDKRACLTGSVLLYSTDRTTEERCLEFGAVSRSRTPVRVWAIDVEVPLMLSFAHTQAGPVPLFFRTRPLLFLAHINNKKQTNVG